MVSISSSPSTVAESTHMGGNVSFTNPNNIKVSDDTYATFYHEYVPLLSRALVCTNFGFSIPTSATIDGIVVEVEGNVDRTEPAFGVYAVISDIYLRKSGSDVGISTSISEHIPTTETTLSTSGTTNLRGTTWTPAEINDPSFGLSFQITANGFYDAENPDPGGGMDFEYNYTTYIDNLRIVVYYTEASTSTGNMFLMF